MEKEKLVIKNFGPIKSVDLDLGKMTILIGDQATGKSTIAKVLAVCRYFSYIVNFNTTDSTDFKVNEQFKEGLNDWGLSTYLSADTEISYVCSNYKFELKCELVQRNNLTLLTRNIEKDSNQEKVYDLKPFTKIEPKGNFIQLISELKALKKDDISEKGKANAISELLNSVLWSPNENFYRLNVKKVMDNPLFVSTERVLQTLSFDKNLLIADKIQDNLKKINQIVRRLNAEKQIEPLSITFKNESGLGYVKKENETEFYPLHFGASGYQAAIPIVIGIKFYTESQKKSKTFIVEEPELNLFPSTQKKLVEFFVENINLNGHSFLIPTHSPYLLSVANDLLLAYKKGQKNKKEVIKLIDEKYWLNPEEFSAYELSDGEAKPIFDLKTGLIGDNMIDEVSDEMNDEFDNLLDI